MNNKNKNHSNIRKAKTADTAFGWVVIVAAVIVLPWVFLVSGVVAGVVASSGRLFVEVVSKGAVFSFLWIFAGIKVLLRTEHAKKYNNIFADYPRMKFADIIAKTNGTLRTVSADLNVMKKRGYWNDMTFDLDNKEVVFTSFPESSEPLPQIGNEGDTVYKQKKGYPIFAIAAAVVTFICFTHTNLFLAAAAGVGIFFLTRLFFPSQHYFIEVKRKTPKVNKPKSTGNETADEMINSVFENRGELARLSQSIVSPKILVPLGEIIGILDQISEFISENPDKVNKLRQFTGYFLPTTVNLLKTYEELEKKPDKGENINAALAKIEEITTNMTKVFKQEYDELYSDKVMDISAEAAVMQSIIDESINNNTI